MNQIVHVVRPAAKQVLQEFYVASTGKLGADPLIVKDILRALERFETVIISLLTKEDVTPKMEERILTCEEESEP